MGFLDFLNGNKSKTITFTTLPKNIEELKAMPQAALTDEYEAAALVVAALCRYEENIPQRSESAEHYGCSVPSRPSWRQDIQATFFLRRSNTAERLQAIGTLHYHRDKQSPFLCGDSRYIIY